MAGKAVPLNVLLITTDQQRFDALGCNNNPHIKTPHLDRLAAQSINLQQHFTSNPICTPARCSILTGRYSRSHGAVNVGMTLPRDTQCLTHVLKQAGYRCAIMGKAHFEPEKSGYVNTMDRTTPYYGFDEHHITEDNMIGEYLEWVERQYPQYRAGAWENSHEENHTPARAGQKNGRIEACYVSSIPEHVHQSAWIADRTIDFLSKTAAENTPSFVWTSFVDPHHPWTPPEDFMSLYDPATLPRPNRKPGENEGMGDSYIHLDGLSDAEYQRLCASYYAMISHIDHHVGRIIGHLERTGQLDKTLVLFTSDHGEYNGDHGLIRKCGPLYDNLLRVPALVRLPGGAHGGTRCHQPTQHEDFVPTILEQLGLEIPKAAEGVSMLPALRGQTPARRYAYFEYKNISRGDGVYGVQRGPWKLLHYPDERDYVLTNLESDPMEYTNVYSSAATAETERELKDALLQWMVHTPRHTLPKTMGW
jgi:arylsulfatase A-like enzyme